MKKFFRCPYCRSIQEGDEERIGMPVSCPTCNKDYILSNQQALSEPDRQHDESAEAVDDRTMPGRRFGETAETVDADATMPGKRDRKPDGRFAVGDLIMNRYEVLAELGQGGMGVVYKCFDKVAGIEVALKALPPELSHNTLEMEDIKENFQLVHNLHHPNIASSNNLEKDNSNGNYYLIMECVAGEDLRRWLKRKRKEGPLTLDLVLPIIRQVAAALDYAHEEQIIHRDIKPGNIMIDARGRVKVLDFGLAAQIHTSMTRVSMAYHGTSGTGPYMAPEQWRGKAQGAAADQYALAVMTYEMLAGHLPFESMDIAVLKQAVLDEQPEEIEGMPVNINPALQRALAKNSKERFENCMAFAEALALPANVPAAAISAVSIAAAPVVPAPASVAPVAACMAPPPPRSTAAASVITGRSKRRLWLKVVGALLLAAVVLLGVFAPKSENQSATETVVIGAEAAERMAKEREKSEKVRKSLNSINLVLPGQITLKLLPVPAGVFTMGSPFSEKEYDSSEKKHQVRLTRNFWLGETEVTQAQWRVVMESNPSNFKGDNLPVECVSWDDAMAFCRKLNELTAGKRPAGYVYSLPTEAQWEYACRAGTAGAYNVDGVELKGLGWFDDNSGGKTHPVKGKRPNAWGFYDMHGNVWERCVDWHGDYNGDAVDPVGPGDGSYRVHRGGGWDSAAEYCRSACRNVCDPGNRVNVLGFRVALVPGQ